MKILFIGDIFGKVGRLAIQAVLPRIKKEYQIDFVIANAENVTDCKGLSEKHYYELISYGIDFFTMGNHTWAHCDIFNLLNSKNNIIRPANINSQHRYSQYGVGSKVVYIKNCAIRITNLLGETIKLNNLQTHPFYELDKIIETNQAVDFHIVDFHAETTGEKNALFYDFSHKVSAIIGTHTHVQTADNRVYNNTAFITDVGSTGPTNGILGAKASNVINKIRHPEQYFVLNEANGPYQFCAVVIEFNECTKEVKSIERILIYE